MTLFFLIYFNMESAQNLNCKIVSNVNGWNDETFSAQEGSRYIRPHNYQSQDLRELESKVSKATIVKDEILPKIDERVMIISPQMTPIMSPKVSPSKRKQLKTNIIQSDWTFKPRVPKLMNYSPSFIRKVRAPAKFSVSKIDEFRQQDYINEKEIARSLKQNLIKFDANGQIKPNKFRSKKMSTVLPKIKKLKIETEVEAEESEEEEETSQYSPSTTRTESVIPRYTPKIGENTPDRISKFFPTPDYPRQPPKFKQDKIDRQFERVRKQGLIIQLAQVPSSQDYVKYAAPDIDKSKLNSPSSASIQEPFHSNSEMLQKCNQISGEMTTLRKEQTQAATDGFRSTTYQSFLAKTHSSSPFGSGVFNSPTALGARRASEVVSSAISKSTKNQSFYYSPSMIKDFSDMHQKSSSRQIILQSKFGGNYLKNKKLSLSGVKGSPKALNAFLVGQLKLGDLNSIIDAAQNKPIVSKTNQISEKTSINQQQRFEHSKDSECSSNLTDFENNLTTLKDVQDILENSQPPEKVEISNAHRRRLLEIKKQKGEEWSKNEHEYMKVLLRYWSPKCMYTSNAKQIEKQFDLYSKGFLTESDLRKDVAKVKHQYEIATMEEFSKNYNDIYETNPDPIKFTEKYKFSQNYEQIIRFTDNVIFFKKKMIALGLRDSEQSLVYINKSKQHLGSVSIFDGPIKNIKLTKQYQNQPTLCKIAKMASLLLLKIYGADPRYLVDDQEMSRLKDDPKNNCEQHGNDKKEEMKKKALQGTRDFYERLVKPGNDKVQMQLLMNTLIKLIKNSQDVEFSNLRKIVKERMTKEQLMKINPMIFLKDKTEQPPDFSTSVKVQDIGSISNKVILENEEVFINQILLETIVQDIKDSFVAKNSKLPIIPESEPTQETVHSEQHEIPDDVQEIEPLINEVQELEKVPSTLPPASPTIHQKKVKQIELLHEKYVEAKFYTDQKGLNAPETPSKQYFNDLRGNLREPVFKKIVDGSLNLSGHILSPAIISALSSYISSTNLPLHTLILDDCQLSDSSLAQLLGSIRNLRSLTYSNNEVGYKAVEEIRKMLEKSTPTLESISFKKIKADKYVIQRLFEVLEMNPFLQRIKLQEVNLNHPPLMEHMVNHLITNTSLIEFDISFCQILIADLVKMLEVFSDNAEVSQIQHLNLSHINILTEPPQRLEQTSGLSTVKKKKKKKLSTNEKFLKFLSNFLQHNCFLKHLDLSGMNLRDKIRPFIDSITKNQNSQLLSIHLNDNDFSQETKNYIFSKLDIKLQNPQKKVNISLPLENNDLKILGHDLEKTILNKNNVITKNSDKTFGRKENIQDNLILTKKLGHAELIFNENSCFEQELSNHNSEGKWGVTNNCYVCSHYPYVQLFIKEKNLARDFEVIPNPGFDLSTESGNPILISSFNNWIKTRFIDVQVYCQLLKSQDQKFTQIQIEDMRYKPLKRTNEQKITTYRLENDIRPDINGDFPQIPMEKVNQFLEQFDLDQVSNCNRNLKNGICGDRLDIYQKILGMESEIDEGLYDIFTNNGWSQILEELFQIPDTIKINYKKEQTDENSKIKIFAGYVKPGKHTVIIYSRGQYYKKEYLIRARKNDVFLPQWTIQEKIPKKTLGVPLESEEAEPMDIADYQDFVFKDWYFDSSSNLKTIFQNSVMGLDFSIIKNIIENAKIQDWKFQILESINKNFSFFNRVFILYNANFAEIGNTESTSEKFVEFLNSINMVTKTGNNKIKMKEEWLYEKGILSNQTVPRHNFILNIYLVAIGMFQKNILIQMNQRQKNMETLSVEKFIKYFETSIFEKLEKNFVNKFEQNQTEKFRRDYIWKVKTNDLLRNNFEYLDLLFSFYKSALKKDLIKKFSLSSALKLVEDSGITLDRLPGIDIIPRLFILSKPSNCSSYQELSYHEFLDFICRLAFEVYHPNYSDQDEKDIYLQMMALMPFEDKVYELLKKYLLPLIGKEISIVGTGPVLNEKKFIKMRKRMKKEAKKAGALQDSPEKSPEKSPEIEGPDPDAAMLIYSDDSN